MVKCLPVMWETQVQSLGPEDPLEKEMAIHSSTLAWKIPWMEEPGRLQSMGSLLPVAWIRAPPGAGLSTVGVTVTQGPKLFQRTAPVSPLSPVDGSREES